MKSPMMSPVRKASNGDFNPSCEVVTMASRRKVKQLRRLQSLCQRIQKFEKQGPTTIRTHHEIVQEWLVILQCKAFGFDFLSWAQYCCNLPPPSCPFPSHDWIFALCQFVKFLVEADLAQDEKIFKQAVEYSRSLDAKDNHSKQAFKKVKGPSLPPIRELQTIIEDDVILQPGILPNTADIFGTHVGQLSCNYPLLVDGLTIQNL